MGQRRTRFRQAFAILALFVLGDLLALALLRSPDPFRTGTEWLLLVPVAIAIGALATRRTWGRWLGLAIAFTVLPWATVLSFDPAIRQPFAFAALAAALVLLGCLAGPEMIRHFEGRSSHVDWFGPRMHWLRWAIIGNLASALGLLLFVGAYRFRFAWHLLLFVAPMAGLLAGVLLLARQKTAGLLIVWLACFLIIPLGAIFIRSEAASTGEALLLAVTFLPGIATGWATAFVFGRPVWRFLRTP